MNLLNAAKVFDKNRMKSIDDILGTVRDRCQISLPILCKFKRIK